MGKKKIRLINGILILLVSSIVLFSAIFLIIQINSFNSSFKKESQLIQYEYEEEQKVLVKREVEWVNDLIQTRLSNLEDEIGQKARERALEAWSIAENLYETNKDSLDKEQIIPLIKEALRSIRYAEGLGYFFITSFTGEVILFADRPELEGKNLYDMQDAEGRYVIRDMIDLARNNKEGFYRYLWTKPDAPGNDHPKISYVKHFEPYDWFIGTGLYFEDEEEFVKKDILKDISTIRFGAEGYVFVNSLDGFALVSNGELLSGKQKLWEVFTSNVEKTKELFRKELYAAGKEGGDYIYYSIRKLSDANTESPKMSYILGIPETNWLIGAGVYLDLVDEEIAALKEIAVQELRTDIINTFILTLSVMSVFAFALFLIGRQLIRDFSYFRDFFSHSADANARIHTSQIRFQELVDLAEEANMMQKDKMAALTDLKKSESRFRLLAENSNDMIFKMLIPEGAYEYISPASSDIVGYDPQEIMSEPMHIRRTIHPQWRKWLEESYEKLKKGIVDESFEYQIITKSGQEKWIYQKNTLIKGDKEDHYILIGRMSDETRRKKAEEELNRANRMDAIGKLAGGVAHDFNNVLAGIMNAANVLKSPKREIDEKGRKMADLIFKAATHAAELTAKLSAFGGKRTLVFKTVDVHHIIEETVIILKRTIDKQIEILLNLKASNPHVTGDGTELQSLIINLSINASHAISGNGSITISTSNINRNGNPFLSMEIKDTGAGIDSVTLERIFEPFFTTKEKGKGTGLGLATVYRAVTDHKGYIDVKSTVGEGTVFTILIPGTEQKAESQVEKPEVERKGSGNILLIDDEDIILETGKSILEEMGYSVLTASDGLKGLEVFKDKIESIDLVILDVIMPVLGGIDTYFEIKKIRNDCPVIFVSGRTDKEDLEIIKNSDITAFLKKPFEEASLKKAIDRALNI